MKINSNFDGGNIEVVSIDASDNIQLKIRKDIQAKYLQWFYFHFMGEKNKEYKLKIINASDTTYPKGWSHYKAFASYDNNEWFRVPTDYDGNQLIIKHTLSYDSVYYAYFVPYSYERHQDLISASQLSNNCKAEILCQTINGHELSLLMIGEPAKYKKKCWIIARQHPGETMAEWFCEGLIKRLLNWDDKVVKSLLTKAEFYIVPNMNPDGSVLGNLRANGLGINLNRQWQSPDKNIAPEVFFVQQKMQETGVDFFFDVHGDEDTPYVFTIDNSQNPCYTRELKELEDLFKKHYHLANPDFQIECGYEPNRFSTNELLTTAPYAICNKYGCLTFTLEMPFTDNANRPDEKNGWTSQRSIQLGYALVDPLVAIIDQL